MLKIAVGCDHGGYSHKEKIKVFLKEQGYHVTDSGTFNTESVDYPDYGEKVADLVSEGKADMGILVCGTGIGMSITANKVRGIRAALCWNTESARLTREHNDANILCVSGRLLNIRETIEIVKTFINTPFPGIQRHMRRINKIMMVEERNFGREK